MSSVEGPTNAKEADGPAELLAAAKLQIRMLVDEGLADVRAGLVVDGPTTMKKLRDELESRRRA